MADFKDLEHRSWVSKARFYDDHFASVTRQAIDPVLSGLGDLSGRALLDICCGTGDLAETAAHRGAAVTGVDFAAPMVEIAEARVPRARFAVGDAENLPMANAGFDLATCLFGLWHLENPDAAIGEAARMLRPGGSFAYTAWLPPEEGWDLMALLVSAITAHGTMDVDLPPAPPPFRFSRVEEAETVLKAAGFATVTAQREQAIWTGRTGEALMDLLYKGTVRAPMLVEAQILSDAETLRDGDLIRMRWPYQIVTATRA